MSPDQIIQTLLNNRGLVTQPDIDEFFHPSHPSTFPSLFSSDEAISLIDSHFKKNSKIYIIGDYDVDGVCSTAILWETLHSIYPLVYPVIPHRRDDGYGLSNSVIEKVLAEKPGLIISVDCGITSHESVARARHSNCDVIIIDHHEPKDSLPEANVILHSTKTSAAGLAWLFCRDLLNFKLATLNIDHLSLVALSVICDMIPLIGINRSFAKYGLAELNSTNRVGLQSLYKVAGIDPTLKRISTYELGFVLGPRINAMGRLDHALDSLRLLCTKDPQKAIDLATVLNDTNLTRQELTQSAVTKAVESIKDLPNLIIVSDPAFDEGIIGLVASKLVEKFHRPAIAFSINGETAKGSARSLPGFNIIDHLRSFEDLFISVGGHAMAAGMTLSTSNISKIPQPEISSDLFIKKHRFDMEISLADINVDLYLKLQDFAPFGLGNPQPVFKSKDVEVSASKKIGKQLQHLKFKANNLDAIHFNVDPNAYSLMPTALTYSLDLNIWNGQSNLQLMIKLAEV